MMVSSCYTAVENVPLSHGDIAAFSLKLDLIQFVFQATRKQLSASYSMEKNKT